MKNIASTLRMKLATSGIDQKPVDEVWYVHDAFFTDETLDVSEVPFDVDDIKIKTIPTTREAFREHLRLRPRAVIFNTADLKNDDTYSNIFKTWAQAKKVPVVMLDKKSGDIRNRYDRYVQTISSTDWKQVVKAHSDLEQTVREVNNLYGDAPKNEWQLERDAERKGTWQEGHIEHIVLQHTPEQRQKKLLVKAHELAVAGITYNSALHAYIQAHGAAPQMLFYWDMTLQGTHRNRVKGLKRIPRIEDLPFTHNGWKGRAVGLYNYAYQLHFNEKNQLTFNRDWRWKRCCLCDSRVPYSSHDADMKVKSYQVQDYADWEKGASARFVGGFTSPTYHQMCDSQRCKDQYVDMAVYYARRNMQQNQAQNDFVAKMYSSILGRDIKVGQLPMVQAQIQRDITADFEKILKQ